MDNGKFVFPDGFDNGLRLKDMLEESVDGKYYINTPNAQRLIENLIADGKLNKAGGGGTTIDQQDCFLVNAQN